MERLEGIAEEEARGYMAEAARVALSGTCWRSRCGSVIVKAGVIIGDGYNSPPGGLESQCRCGIKKADYDIKVTDKTCCVHAEQRAMFSALRNHPDKLPGSTLYFVRVDEDGEILPAGDPYCTICSKMAIDLGIRSWVLWHEEGLFEYDAAEYNDASFDFRAP